MRHVAEGGLNVSLRTKALGGAALVVIAVVGASALQSPSDDIGRIAGTDRINRDTVLLTVKFNAEYAQGGPHSVAVSWHSRVGILGPPLDDGNDVAHQSPYTRVIQAAAGAEITAAAVPAKRDGNYQAWWTTECWLHQGGKLLPGGKSYDKGWGARGCAVSGIAI